MLVRNHHALMQVCVMDIGSLGCRFSKAEGLSIGSFVTLVVDGLPDLEAWVAWSTRSEAGVAFAYRPPHSVIARLSTLDLRPTDRH
ncbi:hypothetical protein [Sphingomonas sp. S2-65]|uniref:hypothetical protein n=1 Tax=Sphingomonas sp. S2-65 TaxID=2903960 RepID=UPI001F2BAA30|nr:hypothetical protein [Sphingomonas sp. S2-65]UYY57313.1 hypothetical protein LZ586_11530 [Sphingomonas sp. S2-65]